MINFVGKEHQWTKAKVGILCTSMPIQDSICSNAVASMETLVVSDLTRDGRFFNHPLVKGVPFAMSYIGVPIISREGFALGALCVLDVVVRDLSLQQMNILKKLANQVVVLLERKRLQSSSENQASIMQVSVAHQMNNLLSILQARASLLSTLGRDGKVTSQIALEHADKMLEGTKKMGEFMRDLSTYFGEVDTLQSQKNRPKKN